MMGDDGEANRVYCDFYDGVHGGDQGFDDSADGVTVCVADDIYDYHLGDLYLFFSPRNP